MFRGIKRAIIYVQGVKIVEFIKFRANTNFYRVKIVFIINYIKKNSIFFSVRSIDPICPYVAPPLYIAISKTIPTILVIRVNNYRVYICKNW